LQLITLTLIPATATPQHSFYYEWAKGLLDLRTFLRIPVVAYFGYKNTLTSEKLNMYISLNPEYKN
jgi:hypothetical protein